MGHSRRYRHSALANKAIWEFTAIGGPHRRGPLGPKGAGNRREMGPLGTLGPPWALPDPDPKDWAMAATNFLVFSTKTDYFLVFFQNTDPRSRRLWAGRHLGPP